MLRPNLNKLKHTDSGNFFLIAGPCVIEDLDSPYLIAEKLVKICDHWKIPLIFKASYKKANRTRVNSFTGIGRLNALIVLREIGKEFDIPVITDVHEVNDINLVKDYVDVLQIPAFLSRQTDLIEAAAKTGLPINIKKGQFMSAESMQFVVEKYNKATTKRNLMLTERGSSFGYNDLIVDFRGIPIMQKHKYPVILDITHSVQRVNVINEKLDTCTIEDSITLAKAGLAVGVDGIFMEVHPDPRRALSDGGNMIPLHYVNDILFDWVKKSK